jgi:hypothetical protein
MNIFVETNDKKKDQSLLFVFSWEREGALNRESKRDK